MSGEIQALIELIDDPDEQIFAQVKDRLLDLGASIIPDLELAWEQKAFGVLFQNRVEDLIHSIQFDQLKKRITDWLNADEQDLLEGVLLINQYQYPDLDIEAVTRKINKLRQDIWLEFNDELTAFEQVKIINHFLFEIHGYSANTSNYHAPQNSFLNVILDSKKGNPLSLSILYLLISQHLNLPIYGVNLPSHFVLCYQDENNILQFLQGQDEHDVLFYINPFSKGAITGKSEIDAFIKELKLEPHEKYYTPCSHASIINRIINNLIYSYEKLGYHDKIEELNELRDIFKHSDQ